MNKQSHDDGGKRAAPGCVFILKFYLSQEKKTGYHKQELENIALHHW